MTASQLFALLNEAFGIVARIVKSRLGGPDTRGVLVILVDDNDQVLLVKARYRRSWSLPGGWVDPDESFADAACREVAEEGGVELSGEPVFVGALDRSHHIDHIYVGHRGAPSTRPATPWEISAIQWMSPDRIPELSRTSMQALALRRTKMASPPDEVPR